MKHIYFLSVVFTFIMIVTGLSSISLLAQSNDTIKRLQLQLVTIDAIAARTSISRLEPISGTFLFSGKKSEIISLHQTDANITEKTGRQLFAKVPGVFVYDMEGGNQINIATRGLDPHRGWEFNLRKDGVLTNSDMYAYPASHYSVPMESIDRIELVRGTGSLQYGAQFGGMLNYVSKQGDTSKPISLESYNTVGSFNLLSSYNAIGGKLNKLKYYAYYAKRSRDGYRKYEHTDYDAQGLQITYDLTQRFSIHLDVERSNYTYRLPGPLTDEMFKADPRQASRSRNYFNPTITIPSLTLKWDIASNTKLQFVSSAVLGVRNSILYDKVATIKDTINTTTMSYNNRQIDIDRFNSYTQELRILHQYKIGKMRHNLVGGMQLMTNHLHRTQLGKGTNGSDFDLTLVDPIWGRDLHFKTKNLAFFAENNFNILKNLSVNVGARIEMGESKMNGNIVYYPENQIPVSIPHKFPLFGSSFSYKPSKYIDIYGGFSQTYRPMLFKDIVPSSTFEKVDSNIKDASGYNAELGFRGKYKFIQWDVTAFVLRYNNRFGTIAFMDSLSNFYTYRTNIGNSLTKGVEVFLQGNWYLSNSSQLILFTSTSLMDGRYISGEVKSGNSNISIKGNKIESVPNLISRNGITFQYSKLSLTALYSYTSKTFADALNTEMPNSSGSVGLVPSYGILDLNTSLKFGKHIELKASVNNILNKQYFTKRPMFYPGPGIWSSDGRSATCSVIFKI